MRRTWLPRIRIRRARDGRAAPALPGAAVTRPFAWFSPSLGPEFLPGFALPGFALPGLASAVLLVLAFAGPSAAVEIGSQRAQGAGVLAIADGSAALGGPDCTCRYFGVNYRLGETVCLRSPEGPRLARCSMVLNNTTWETLDRSCPTSARAPMTLAAAPLCLPGG